MWGDRFRTCASSIMRCRREVLVGTNQSSNAHHLVAAALPTAPAGATAVVITPFVPSTLIPRRSHSATTVELTSHPPVFFRGGNPTLKPG